MNPYANNTIHSRSVASILRDNDWNRSLAERLNILTSEVAEREVDLDQWAADNGFTIPAARLA